MNKKIKRLKFHYKPNNAEEKKEIDSVLMHATGLLEYRNKIINAFENGIFLVEQAKEESKDVLYDFVLVVVNNSCKQKIESMPKNIINV